MINKIKIALALVILFINVSAQKKWSLEQCIKYALENNIQIKQSELNVKSSENNHLQSKLDILPNLNGSSGYNRNWGRNIDPYTNEFTENNISSMNFSISSSFTLFNGFQKLNTIKQNEFNLKASIQDVEKMKNDITLNIAAAYLQILFNKEMLEISKEQVKTSKLQFERTKKLVDAGSLPEGNLLEAQSQAASDELQQVNNQNQLELSKLDLIQLLELDSANNFDIIVPEVPEPDKEILNITIEDIYNKAVNEMPEILASEMRLKSSETGLKIASGARYPRLSVTGSYGTGYSSSYEQYTVSDSTIYAYPSGYAQVGTEQYTVYSYNYDIDYTTETRPFDNQIKNNASTSLGINLSIPIFNGYQISNSVSNAKINIENAKYNLELSKNQLLKDIQQKYADVVAAAKQYQATKKALVSIKKSFDYAQQKYNLGLENFLDYSLAKNNLVKTKSELVQAKYDFIFKLKILDFYKGIPIKLNE